MLKLFMPVLASMTLALPAIAADSGENLSSERSVTSLEGSRAVSNFR